MLKSILFGHSNVQIVCFFYLFIVIFLKKLISCCKKRQKKSQPRNWFGNRGRLKVLNDTKLVLKSISGPLILDHQNLVSIRTFRRPLFPKPVFGWYIFAASYSKTALVTRANTHNFTVFRNQTKTS